jgi:hypothetical protein
VIFKDGFRKAYAKIKWILLVDVLKMKGFLVNGKLAIMIDDKIGSSIITKKGLRCGGRFLPFILIHLCTP